MFYHYMIMSKSTTRSFLSNFLHADDELNEHKEGFAFWTFEEADLLLAKFLSLYSNRQEVSFLKESQDFFNI